jgi:hypothetical protein
LKRHFAFTESHLQNVRYKDLLSTTETYMPLLQKTIPLPELLRRVFGIEVVCGKCQNPLRLIALIKTEETAKKILAAMHLPTEVPQLHPARPPPTREAPSDEDWVN